MEQYTKLTGDDGWNAPIIKVGAYLDGYNKELKVLDKIKADIEGLTYYWCEVNPKSVIDDVLQIIDKYKIESEE